MSIRVAFREKNIIQSVNSMSVKIWDNMAGC